jgi:hypothetical protein
MIAVPMIISGVPFCFHFGFVYSLPLLVVIDLLPDVAFFKFAFLLDWILVSGVRDFIRFIMGWYRSIVALGFGSWCGAVWSVLL